MPFHLIKAIVVVSLKFNGVDHVCRLKTTDPSLRIIIQLPATSAMVNMKIACGADNSHYLCMYLKHQRHMCGGINAHNSYSIEIM